MLICAFKGLYLGIMVQSALPVDSFCLVGVDSQEWESVDCEGE